MGDLEDTAIPDRGPTITVIPAEAGLEVDSAHV